MSRRFRKHQFRLLIKVRLHIFQCAVSPHLRVCSCTCPLLLSSSILLKSCHTVLAFPSQLAASGGNSWFLGGHRLRFSCTTQTRVSSARRRLMIVREKVGKMRWKLSLGDFSFLIVFFPNRYTRRWLIAGYKTVD